MNPDLTKLAQTTHDNLQIAIETTGLGGSVAVLRGETVLRDTKLDSGRRTAAVLGPVLAETLQWCRGTKNEPQFFSIADGPGSFTGLRIGVTTAKTLAYACKLPLVSVDSLAAIAATAFSEDAETGELLVGINAYRGQVFTAAFRRDRLLIPLAAVSNSKYSRQGADQASGAWSAHPDHVRVVDADNWRKILEQLPQGDDVTGDRKVFQLRTDLTFVHRQLSDAVGVGLLAARAAAQGAWSDPLALAPRYLRPSAAEEKAAAAAIKPRSA